MVLCYPSLMLTISSLAFPVGLCLSSILHVPQLRQNLMYVKQVCQDNNCIVIFNDSYVRFKDNIVGEVLLQASSMGNVYPIHTTSSHIPANVAVRESRDI